MIRWTKWIRLTKDNEDGHKKRIKKIGSELMSLKEKGNNGKI